MRFQFVWDGKQDQSNIFVNSTTLAPGDGCLNRSLMLWGVADFLWVTDRPALRLGDVLQKRGYESGLTALTAYPALSATNLEKGRVNYKIRPKWFL